MAKISIRPLAPNDRGEWEPLWAGYLAFYEATIPAAVTDATWARLNDPAEPMHALGAFLEGRLVGIVHYLFHRALRIAGILREALRTGSWGRHAPVWILRT
jgi:hypothetical protein